RDKIAATRRKGKWCGGLPVLGYDVDPRGPRLVINKKEAGRVRAIFALYLERGSLERGVEELSRRGWVHKRWQKRKGRLRGGRPFTRTSLYQLLTNVNYIGQIRHKTEVHPGEQAAIRFLAHRLEADGLQVTRNLVVDRPRRPRLLVEHLETQHPLGAAEGQF